VSPPSCASILPRLQMRATDSDIVKYTAWRGTLTP
jgi:hypothetical protein